jgi:hypothetical protein
MALAYYGRILFILHLLPLLNASPNNPRIIDILAAGFEIDTIPLDDLDFKEPKNFGIVAATKSLATYTTLALSRIADENPNVVVIHNHPGSVSTDILTRGWGGKWYGKAFMEIMKPLLKVASFSPEDSGERSVYLMTSAVYGGKGVPFADSKHKALTMKKTEEGGLFCVNYKFEAIRQEKIMEWLTKQGADVRVWTRLQEVLAPYL